MKEYKKKITPAPAGDEVHELLLSEVSQQWRTLKPEREPGENEKNLNGRLERYIFPARFFLFYFLLVYCIHYILLPNDTPYFYNRYITSSLLSLINAGVLWVLMYAGDRRRIKEQLRTAIQDKQYIYSYAPVIGLFIVRYQYKNDTYRFCVKLPPKTEKELPYA